MALHWTGAPLNSSTRRQAWKLLDFPKYEIFIKIWYISGVKCFVGDSTVVKFVSGQEIVQAAFGRLLWGHFLRVRKRESVGIDIRKTMPSRLGNNLFYETLNGLFSNNVDGFFNDFNRPGKMIPSGYKPNLAWFRPFLSCKWGDLNSKTSVMIVVCKWPEMERKTLSALKNLFQMFFLFDS